MKDQLTIHGARLQTLCDVGLGYLQITQGAPEQIAQTPESYTGQNLCKLFSDAALHKPNCLLSPLKGFDQ